MRILLVDDHALFREGMSHVLKNMPEAPEVIEAGSADEGLFLAQEKKPLDLVLLDLHLPETDGFTVLARLHHSYADLAVIVLSASEDFLDAKKSLDLGAMGYIPKSATSQIMLGAIRLVLSGGIYLPPLLLSQWHNSSAPAITSSSREASAADSESITARQHDVLRLLAVGKSNKEIARDLGMAEGTVKIHITAIFRALAVVNRTQAVLTAKKMGLVDN